jgi:hypothetical protein
MNGEQGREMSMPADMPRLIMLEDVTDPATRDPHFSGPPVRTLRDRAGNHFVLLSVAQYIRLLSAAQVGERRR